jgi:salicylate hydroxylase
MAGGGQREVIVAGGGIGGLAIALGLAGKGCRVTVLEQASKFGEIGAGIQIGPNAFHALDYLGVGEVARARAVYIDGLVLMDSLSGEQITTIPVDAPFRERFGNPYAVIHRVDLHGSLLEGCAAHASIALVTRQKVVDYEQAGGTVTVRTESGQTFSGDALVGADGINSQIRQQVVGDGPPRVSGHVSYRAVLPVEDMPEELRWNAMTLWAGPRTHLVHYPLSDWKLFNIVCTFHDDSRTEPGAGLPGTREEVMERFAQVCDKPRSILEQLHEWRYWVLCDREPVDNWIDGRVVLLGDAAHPMLQYFAQGACQAMEDAVCLSYHLERTGGDVEAAFLAYQEQRVVHTARVQLMSRLIGDYIFHPGGVPRKVRNAVLGAKTPEQHYDSLQWIYGSSGLPTDVWYAGARA